jgi:hypothetical protein
MGTPARFSASFLKAKDRRFHADRSKMRPCMIALEKLLTNGLFFFFAQVVIVADGVISFHLVDQSIPFSVDHCSEPFDR